MELLQPDKDSSQNLQACDTGSYPVPYTSSLPFHNWPQIQCNIIVSTQSIIKNQLNTLQLILLTAIWREIKMAAYRIMTGYTKITEIL